MTPNTAPSVPLKSTYRDTIAKCPHCQSTDIRGPIDTEPKPPTWRLTRSWFCRQCWWDKAVVLKDDLAANAPSGGG